MKLSYSSIIDFFLLKKDSYAKLTDKSMWLYIGIAFVGIRDVAVSLIGTALSDEDFANKFQANVATLAILALTALVIGLVDVFSFSYPIFDIIKYFKKRGESGNTMTMGIAYSSLLTKVMKVYVLANILITPIDLIGYFTVKMTLSTQLAIFLYISSVLGILSYFWFNGAITRGLCVLFRLPNTVRGLVFALVFFWNAMLSYAIEYLLNLVIGRML